jgi:hypothetical protein
MVKHTEAYSRLVKRIQAVIDRHDPYSLLANGAPPDEFEPLAHAIAAYGKMLERNSIFAVSKEPTS